MRKIKKKENKPLFVIKFNRTSYLQVLIPVFIGSYYLIRFGLDFLTLLVILFLVGIFVVYLIKKSFDLCFYDKEIEIKNLFSKKSRLYKYEDISKVFYFYGGYMSQPGVKVVFNKLIGKSLLVDYSKEKTIVLFSFLKERGVKTFFSESN